MHLMNNIIEGLEDNAVNELIIMSFEGSCNFSKDETVVLFSFVLFSISFCKVILLRTNVV